MVEEDCKLVRKLKAGYADATPDGGLDAADRDALLNVLGLQFTGRHWPRFGGTEIT